MALSESDKQAIRKIKDNFSTITEKICKLYLVPFDLSEKTNLYDGKLERISHGAQHVSRVSNYIIPFWNFYRWLGDADALALTEEEISLLEIVALFHDLARQDDKSIDIWEKDSVTLCEEFLKDNGISPATAKRFAYLIRQKEKGGILGEIFQTGDAFENMRGKKALLFYKVILYHHCKNRPGAFKILLILAAEIRELIALQSDLKHPCEIKIDAFCPPLIPAIPATRDKNKPELKVSYEQAKNCYEKVKADFVQFKFLQIFASGNLNSPDLPPLPPKISIPFSFVKSARADQYCGFEELVHDMTQTNQFQIDVTRRNADKRKWTVKSDGWFERNTKIPMYSKEEKQGYSAINSWSVVTPNGKSPVFRFDRSRKLVGLIQGSKVVRINCALKYDTGTVNRPLDFDYEKDAQNCYEKLVLCDNPILIPTRLFEIFIEKNQNDSKIYTEILLRAKFDLAETRLGIFLDSFESKILAQYYKQVVLKVLKLQAKETNVALPPQYDVPIQFYLPENSKNWQFYSLEEQEKDQRECLRIWKDIGKRNEQFKNNDFEFLLFVKPTDDVLQKTFYKGLPIFLYILRQGYVHIAKELLLQAKTYSLNQLIPYLGKKPNEATYSEPALPYLALQQDHSWWGWFISQGADMDSLDEEGNNALLKVAIAGKAEQATYLLTLMKVSQSHINYQNKKGETALYHFVDWKNKEMVWELLRRGADRNAETSKGVTPLHVAVNRNYLAIVGYLVNAPIDINKRDENHWTPLHFAANNGYLEITQYLFEKNASIDAKTTVDKTPLHLAAFGNHYDVVQYLVKRGADVNAVDKYGNRVLHYAHSLEIIKCLIQYGAKINAEGAKGNTILHLAAYKGNDAIVRYLIKNGAQIWRVNKNLNTAWEIAIEQGHLKVFECSVEKNVMTEALFKALLQRQFKIAKYLIEKMSPPYRKDKYGETVLHYAAQQGDLETVRLLIKKDRSLLNKYNNNTSPLFSAIFHDHYEVVKYLIKEGASIIGLQDRLLYMSVNNNDIDLVISLIIEHQNQILCSTKSAAFKIAAEKGFIEILKRLIDAGVQIDERYVDDQTALILAAKGGQNEVVKCLVQKKAEINKEDRSKQTALFYALENKNYEMIKFLIENGADTGFYFHQLILLIAKENDDDLFKKIFKPQNELFKPEIKWVFERAFFRSIYQGCLGAVEFLVEKVKVVDINKTDEDKKTALYCAIKCKAYDIAKYLIKCKVNVNVPNGNGDLPLHRVIENGDFEMTKYLIEEGKADINKSDSSDWVALHFAVYGNDTEIAKYLIEKRHANVTLKTNSGQTALHLAAKKNNLELVKLLASKMDINIKDNDGNSPLHYAATNGYDDILEFLIKCENIDLNILNKDKVSALYLAAQNMHLESVNKLLTAGAEFEKDGVIAKNLHRLALRYEDTDIYKAFLGKGLDINLRIDNDGEFALYKAVEIRNFNLIEFLIKNKANINQVTNINESPLYCAVKNKNLKLVELLVNNGADIIQVAVRDRPVMYYALENNDLDIVKYLLNKGVNLFHQAIKDIVYLHSGCVATNYIDDIFFLFDTVKEYRYFSSNTEEFKNLVKKIPEALYLTDASGYTLLTLAILSENSTIAGFLIDRGVKITPKCLDKILTKLIETESKYSDTHIIMLFKQMDFNNHQLECLKKNLRLNKLYSSLNITSTTALVMQHTNLYVKPSNNTDNLNINSLQNNSNTALLQK